MPPTGDQQRNEAAAFVELLLATARQTEVPVYVVVTMRSEFLGHCDAFHGLPEAINDSQFLTPADDARSSARGHRRPGPNCAVAEVEPVLVNRILNEIGTDPDQLPLMQHALLRTWQQAVKKREADGDGNLRLELDDYTAVGGLQLALCNHADQAVAELLGLPPEKVLGVETEKIRKGLTTDEQRARLRTIEMLFRSLCEQKEEGPLVRRVVSVAEVLATVCEKPRPAGLRRSGGRGRSLPRRGPQLPGDHAGRQDHSRDEAGHQPRSPAAAMDAAEPRVGAARDRGRSGSSGIMPRRRALVRHGPRRACWPATACVSLWLGGITSGLPTLGSRDTSSNRRCCAISSRRAGRKTSGCRRESYGGGAYESRCSPWSAFRWLRPSRSACGRSDQRKRPRLRSEGPSDFWRKAAC